MKRVQTHKIQTYMLKPIWLDLWSAQRECGEWFSVRLFHLIMKSDLSNLERIRKGFPEEVAVFEQWNKEGWLEGIEEQFIDQVTQEEKAA
jgi:hypothetical protein